MRLRASAVALAVLAACSGTKGGSSSSSSSTGGSSATSSAGATTGSTSSASSSSGSSSGSTTTGTSAGSTGSTGSSSTGGSTGGSTGSADNALSGPLAFPVPYVQAFKHFDSTTHAADLSKVSVRYAQLLASPGAAACVTTGEDAGAPALGQSLWVEVQAAPQQQVAPGSYAIASVPDGGSTAVTLWTTPNGSTFTRAGGAVSGAVTLTALDANQIAGSFQVNLVLQDGGNSALSGTFASPLCDLATN